MRIDPIYLEIMNHKTSAIVEQMGHALQRTGRTLFVKETMDFATGLVDLKGRFFAYPNTMGVTTFMNLNCLPTIEKAGVLVDGDVVITNHPYISEGLATHLPDLHLIKPYFYKNNLVCYGWCFIHSTDVGGNVASSVSPSNKEIFQEGFMIPPTKIMKEGILNDEFIEIYASNCRTPDDNMGDLRAMLAALRGGEQAIEKLIRQHDAESFIDVQEVLQDYAAQKARNVLRLIPDGTYAFRDFMDDDVITPFPVCLSVKMTSKDGLIHLDFTATDPQVPSSYNIPTAGKSHPFLTHRLINFMFSRDSSLPRNSGLYRPISVQTREGTIVNVQFPGAVGVRAATAQRVRDVMTGALNRAVPGLIPACGAGVAIPVVLAETGSGTRGPNIQVIEPVVGGMGGQRGNDGVDGRDAGPGNLSNNPVESVEADCQVIVHRYDTRIDSGGPGQWRGGAGIVIKFEVLQDASTVLARGMERLRFSPWGVAGGRPGAPLRVRVTRRLGAEVDVGKIDSIVLNKGDIITIMSPGGGGYGHPYARCSRDVLTDVQRGYVSEVSASRDYGVVIVDGEIDEVSTNRLRSKDSIKDPEFTFCDERKAWEAIFDEVMLGRINDHLFSLPLSVRAERRREILRGACGDEDVLRQGAMSDVLSDSAIIRGRLIEALDKLQTGFERQMP
jgi:N-methylhydantoinase B